jgi:sigma-54 dependent transcriptional regulator, acetoin dehydrogenase operon transcriptional activator AcoR
MSKAPSPFDATGRCDETRVAAEGSLWASPKQDRRRIYDEKTTHEAWEAFLTSSAAVPSCSTVRSVIERSWQRSVDSGVDARGRGSTLISSPDDLAELRIKNEDLLASATQTFHRVVEILDDAATMVVITDNEGTVLDVSGDRRTIEAGHDIRLEVGATWNETVTGTNGIGTTLVTGQPVHVHAAEHFCEGVKAWTCVGAPIHSPMDGSIIGIIDFSGPQQIFHRHNVALAVIAANHIELALSEKMRAERMQLLEACLDQIPSLGRCDGFVVLDRFGRIVHHNDAAQARWRGLVKAYELSIGSKLLNVDARGAGRFRPERLPEELRGQAFEPLVIGGSERGAVLILGAKSKLKGTVKQTIPGSSTAAAMARAAIVGRSEILLQAIEKAERVAKSKMTVLLEGETGVGKELFARLIHAVGQETGREPFVALNCGAVSKELLGGELFGHAPGAFTGATREGRPGRFEAADGGVLSLDEIGEMPIELQPYLLRVLEERAVYRLGDSKPRSVEVRLIASTNRSLKQETEDGRFRKDLYFRISALRITIPPLRERPGDVEILIDHFNREFSTTYASEPLRFDGESMTLLRHYDWPGNVRELRNLIESLALTASNRMIKVGDFPEEFVGSAQTQRPSHSPAGSPQTRAGHQDEIIRLGDMERQIILKAVAAAGGNISLAADKLGVSRSTLYRKMQQYRMQD